MDSGESEDTYLDRELSSVLTIYGQIKVCNVEIELMSINFSDNDKYFTADKKELNSSGRSLDRVHIVDLPRLSSLLANFDDFPEVLTVTGQLDKEISVLRSRPTIWDLQLILRFRLQYRVSQLMLRLRPTEALVSRGERSV